MTDDFIWIVTDDRPEVTGGEKGLFDKIGLKQVAVDPQKLEAEWNKFLRAVGKLLTQAEEQVGSEADLKLDEVTLAVEINSKGQVSLMGAGSVEAAGKGAITLKFKRVESK